ncbi:NAD(P)H-quinone oxidoreductase [Pisciglobus halotolerans]|uniref:Putative NAD(P)H quinone oxidoreductase, PIG3 family n=1 Tax=Pisciglobus halotolerans TaxID=745365 RepID=A0A1I3CNV1_9LACT|nr:NAD(P)H-quinone oxidoreductase [Pisciglobus halotolerans]SFH75919.1 putative NAD(P)H quinone oxidoreductase, PIG3 family [Pisciglobus halotolerans]
MKAITIKKPGSAEALTLVEREKPVAKKGELLIRVKASAVNRTDTLKRQDPTLSEPYPILGVEAAGVVEENHSEDPSLAPGTRVAGIVNQGSYAEYVTIPADRAIVLPERLNFAEGAAIPEVFLTAYQTLYWLGKLEKGQTVLIHAGASGVGTAAIQLAKQLTEAIVIVTAGSQEKLDFCRKLGADKGINYKKENFADQVLEWTNQAGVDVILDFVGASYWQKNMKSIKKDGHWILIGTLGGHVVPEVDLLELMGKRITLAATLLTPRLDHYKAALTQEFVEKALPLLANGTIKPIIDTAFPLQKAAQAHQYMEENKNIGKIILTVE